MGEFAIVVRDTAGACGRIVARNALAYRAHKRLLPTLTNPADAVVNSYKIGFAGPMFTQTGESPDGTAGGEDFGIAAWNQLSDFSATEFGRQASDMLTLENLSRQTVIWTVTRDNRGALIQTGWHTFTSRQGWTPGGTTKPSTWDGAHPTEPYQEPPAWLIDTWETAQDFPWTFPRINPRYWINSDGSGPENPWGVSCPSCNTYGIELMSIIPVGAVFVTVTRAGMGDELLAAATFNGPDWLRVSGSIMVQYRGRFG